jgi:hypothetical protein
VIGHCLSRSSLVAALVPAFNLESVISGLKSPRSVRAPGA